MQSLEPLEELDHAKRPLIAFGAGVRGSQLAARIFATNLGIPIVTTWGAKDMFPESIGTFGTHGVRAANLAIQNCDWLLTIGTRLDTKATGNLSMFAPRANRWMVDIDESEINKFSHMNFPIVGRYMDAGEFIRIQEERVNRFMLHQSIAGMPSGRIDVAAPDFSAWREQCSKWVDENPPGPGVPYTIMRSISEMLQVDDVVVSDTGSVLAWVMQGLDLPCRFIHSFNQTPMGCGIPMAIGSAFATGKRVILLTGDGGLSVCINEIATVVKHNLNIKIILFNNRGYAMCRQTQRQWLGSRYHGADDADLSTPDFKAVCESYGYHDLIEYHIDTDAGVSPQVNFGEALA